MSLERLKQKLNKNPEYKKFSDKVDKFEKKLRKIIKDEKNINKIVDLFIDII